MAINGPDESTDVIVHFINEIDAADTMRRTDTWHVFVGDAPKGRFLDESKAIEEAKRIAIAEGVPAWMLGKAGYPLTKIDPELAE